MNTKKLLAVAMVLCMMATCFVVIADTDDARGDEILPSKYIQIDVDREYKYVASQLKLLGVTDESGWQVDESTGYHKLTLTNINFSTWYNFGIMFYSCLDKESPGLIIELKGDNHITTSTFDGSAYIEDDGPIRVGIYATHYKFVPQGRENCNDFNLKIIGNGSLTITHKGSNPCEHGSFGIKVNGPLEIDGGVTINANACDLDHKYVDEIYNKYARVFPFGPYMIWSVGIYSSSLTVKSDADNPAKIFANGGKLDVTFNTIPDAQKKHYHTGVEIQSAGILCSAIDVENCLIVAKTGDITLKNIEIAKTSALPINTVNVGIGVGEAEAKPVDKVISSINNCSITAIAGAAPGVTNSLSGGLHLKTVNDITTIKDSIITGVGGDATAVSSAFSNGVTFLGESRINGSLISGRTGTIAEAGMCGSSAIFTNANISFSDSIVFASGVADDAAGLYCVADVKINDSDLYLYGDDVAFYYLDGKLDLDKGYRGLFSYNKSGVREQIDISKMKEAQSLEVLYKYDVIYYTDYGMYDFVRSVNGECFVSNFNQICPPGMEFDKWVDINGKEVKAGDKISVDEPYFIEAVFKEKASQNVDAVLWAIIAGVVAIVAIVGVAFHFVRKN